ncbi:hypothetical protein H6F67_08515 [Microcoleus sp. FACHB-1515]|uniref:hypothetical protein n=1 Tax=Cyanophyceae TaxID=3028117 RepID=UPI001682C6B5|nr:hypothetical protein [Microcoleus sp. FACHB-1515]MBD2089896.1 hypothetical protein [Microcoleus sp. FACHB-1515]
MTKPQLQRIESTLAKLGDSSEANVPALPSFKISASTTAARVPRVSLENASLPNLPKFKPPSISSHHHAANPALAANLLKTIATKVNVWQTELQQVMRQIQALYEEGPIIDGWLDAHAPSTAADPSTLRHAEVDRLMDYVQEICQTPSAAIDSSPAGYRLCGLDTDGKLWSRPCPPDQLPQVSLAIARYQKLRQLLARKQQLETQLHDLAQTLIPIQTHLQSLS